MEIKLDIGANVYEKLENHAKISSKSITNFAIDMLDLDMRVYQSSLEKPEDATIDEGVKYEIFL